MNGKRFSEEKARKSGFYLALAVCLTAVGIAAWSTYDAVHSYLAPTGSTSSLPAVQSAAEIRKPTAVPAEDDPEKPAAEIQQTQTTPEPTAAPTPRPTPQPTAAPAAEQTDALPEAPQIPANGPLYELSEQMIAPLKTKEVSKAYSAGAPVYPATMKDWRIHKGADFAAEPGEEVRACANGQVRETYTDSMLGNVIVVEHGDYVFSYCGVGENFLVRPGDVVTKGQVIGTVTAVPCESADQAHLHVEARRDSVWLDPQTVIAGE